MIGFYNFRGRIKYFTCPPETFSPTTHLGASIVTDMAKEFSLDDVDFAKKEEKVMEELPSVRPSATVAVESMGFFEGSDRMEETDENEMECDDEETSAKGGGKKKSVRFGAADSKTDVKISAAKLNGSTKKNSRDEAIKKKGNPEMSLPGNQRANKLQKVQMKKAKKEHARRGNKTF